MKVIVIVVTYNATKWLDRCVNSILNSSIKVDSVFIDNGSTDNTVYELREKYNLFVIECGENLGFGKANNIGVKYAIQNNYDYVYLLNQDAWIYENTIKDLISIQRIHPEYGIISPMQMKGNEIDLDTNFVGNVIKSNNMLINDSFCKKLKDIYDVESVMAAHWLISKDCFTKVGLFSPTFPHYGEDDNYIQRARFHGFKIGIHTRSFGVHDRGNRETSLKKQLHWCSFIQHLIAISDVNNNSIIPYVKMIVMNIRYSMSFHSIIPIGNIIKILVNSFHLMKNKKISKSIAAFYNY